MVSENICINNPKCRIEVCYTTLAGFWSSRLRTFNRRTDEVELPPSEPLRVGKARVGRRVVTAKNCQVCGQENQEHSTGQKNTVLFCVILRGSFRSRSPAARSAGGSRDSVPITSHHGPCVDARRSSNRPCTVHRFPQMGNEMGRKAKKKNEIKSDSLTPEKRYYSKLPRRAQGTCSSTNCKRKPAAWWRMAKNLQGSGFQLFSVVFTKT